MIKSLITFLEISGTGPTNEKLMIFELLSPLGSIASLF